MKLVFVNRYFYPDNSATAQLLSSLAFALAERGWEIAVVTGRWGYAADAAGLPRRELVQGVQVHRVWTSHFGRAQLLGRMADYLTFYGSAAWRLWRLTRRDDIIIAETDPPMLSVMAASVASARKAKLINWVQDLFPEVAQALQVGGVSGTVAWFLQKLRDRSLRAAALNVALGERMREKIGAAGVRPTHTCTISNWACGQAMTPVARNHNQFRREWRVQDKFVVGYSGNMGRAHEFGTIVEAARLLKKQSHIVFVWIGDGAQRSWLEQEACRSGLVNFLFKPYQAQDRLCESLSLPDVHLISLRPALEGLIVPSKVYGIAAVGRPALFVGDIDGEISTLLRQHRCGYSVALGESDTLAARILELSADTALCQRMGANARRAFEENYEGRLAFERWERVLRQVASPSAIDVRHDAPPAVSVK